MKTLSAQHNNSIQPFNLATSGIREMLARTIPVDLGIAVTVLKDPKMSRGDAAEKLDEIHDSLAEEVAECMKLAPQFGINSDIQAVHTLTDMCIEDWIDLSIELESWRVDGLYIQVGFYNRTMTFYAWPVFPVATAMTIYDVGVAATGFINPEKHLSLTVDSVAALDYHLIVGDFFKEDVGIWCQALVEFRNMVMVKCRAIMANRDPDEEYQRFVDAGGKYFLEYPTLCP